VRSHSGLRSLIKAYLVETDRQVNPALRQALAFHNLFKAQLTRVAEEVKQYPEMQEALGRVQRGEARAYEAFDDAMDDVVGGIEVPQPPINIAASYAAAVINAMEPGTITPEIKDSMISDIFIGDMIAYRAFLIAKGELTGEVDYNVYEIDGTTASLLAGLLQKTIDYLFKMRIIDNAQALRIARAINAAWSDLGMSGHPAAVRNLSTSSYERDITRISGL